MRFRTVACLITLFLLSCRNKIQQKSSSSPQPEKITITRDQVYDLSGYSGNGGGNPFALFDENAFVDPRYDKGPDVYIPTTDCQPRIHPEIYFSKTRGSRIVIDLKTPRNIREIYLYDHSNVSDSCWIYAGSFKKWKAVAAFTTVSSPTSWGWKKILLAEDTRLIMIRFSSYQTDISEMVLYGMPLSVTTEISSPPAFREFTQNTLASFLGVNYVMEDDPKWLKPFHQSRLYNFTSDYDTAGNMDVKMVRFNMLHYGYYNRETGKYVFNIDTIQNINHGNIWYSIRGVSKWMSDLGYTDKDRPVNHPDMDAENPVSYSRHSKMMWNLAAFFGYQHTDTARMSISNIPKQSGRGSMHLFENGNEEDATWVGSKYCSPYEYFAQSSADWDGDEGRLGNEMGIHSADPTSLLMMSGLISLDTNRVKTYRFLCENLRDDQQFIWKGGIQYHHYSTKNGKGISPEQDSLRIKLRAVAECSQRIAPGVPVYLGENGYDKFQSSWQATPLIAGFSPSQSQGIMLLRAINATFFSGFDSYILYWLNDRNPENDPHVYLTSGIVRTMPDNHTLAYPGWYFISTLVQQLGKYRPLQVVQESDNGWIYKYVHSEKPDSVAYFIYKPTVHGTHSSGVVLKINPTYGDRVKKLEFQPDNDSGSSELIPVVDGHVLLNVGEKPLLIFCRESAATK
jgi:hypothetical protein